MEASDFQEAEAGAGKPARRDLWGASGNRRLYPTVHPEIPTLSTSNASWTRRTPSSTRRAPNCARAASAVTGCGSSSRRSRGWGSAQTADLYAIRSLAEAAGVSEARPPFLARGCANARGWSYGVDGRPIQEIFGYPDRLKFRSCITLFAAAAPDDAVFREALEMLRRERLTG